MKKFSVGLPLSDKPEFVGKIIENAQHISEVYFSLPGFGSGRSGSGQNQLYTYNLLTDTLKLISSKGIALNVLFNANCYGKDALAREFFYKIGDRIEELTKTCPISCVTTTSPLIAKFIKENFQGVETRASVNMEIGTVDGMEYLSDYFDGYYLKRELNKDLGAIKKARAWCDKTGKKLFMLANSGCLNNCSAHIFHDNLVAHENEIMASDNAYLFEGVCRSYLKLHPENFLKNTGFIRPEDLHLVENYFDGIKLATRVSKNPSLILNAYVSRSFSGLLPSLTEPDHSGLFYPFVIENKKLPGEYGRKVLTCAKNCENCNYCVTVVKNATVRLEDF